MPCAVQQGDSAPFEDGFVLWQRWISQLTKRLRGMHLSIVTTLYKSAPHLAQFHERATRAAKQVSSDYEIIMVNDGSPDDSQRIAIEICDRDPHVSVIELSRNFGHHKAIMTGLSQARGDWVLLIDCDLEEEPELLPAFYQAAQDPEIDVVYG